MGTEKTYKFVHNNPSIQIRDVGFTNDPFVIAQMPKMVAINSAIEIDLTGQIVSDSIGPRIFSGFGGQVDFIYGASRSKGGKPIIAMPSTTKKGESKIVGFLRQGAGVVTTRAHVRFVVTEYGIADRIPSTERVWRRPRGSSSDFGCNADGLLFGLFV